MSCMRPIFWLIMIIIGGYAVLRLFSRLSGIDILAAMSWSFGARQYGFALGWGFFYLVAAACFVVLLDKPHTLVAMSTTHEGALLGYTEKSGVTLYDPARREYRTFKDYPYMQAAKTFNDAFAVAVVYRNARFNNYEDLDAQVQKPWSGTIVLFAVCIMAAALYMLLYKLAGLYAGPDQVPSHQVMLVNFRQMTGIPFPVAATVLPLLALVPWVMGGYMTHRIKQGYQEQFSVVQSELRRELMASVAPKKVLRGRVISRTRGYDQEKVSDAGRSPSRGKWRSVPLAIFTIEFPGLVGRTPVYLSITLRDLKGDPVIEQLDKLLPAEKPGEAASWKKDDKAVAQREADFIVNSDLCVLLLLEKQRSGMDR